MLQSRRPEIASGRAYLGRAVDLWSFGVMAYEMLTGRLPFVARGTAADLTLRIKGGFKAAIKSGSAVWPSHVKADAKVLITALLDHAPQQRPSASEILQHRWVSANVAPTGEQLPELPEEAEEAGDAPRAIGWYCDVASEGCLRPVPPSARRPYDPAHRCWQYRESYMVCEACYHSGQAEHCEELLLLEKGSEPRELDAAPGRGRADGAAARRRDGPTATTAAQAATHEAAKMNEAATAMYQLYGVPTGA